jgi:hypothetical protein
MVVLRCVILVEFCLPDLIILIGCGIFGASGCPESVCALYLADLLID